MHALPQETIVQKPHLDHLMQNRDGFVLGEGAEVLEELNMQKHVEQNRKLVVAECHLMRSLNAPHPKELSTFVACHLRDGMQPEDVDHINTHGTSTRLVMLQN
jgi:3-oxoacyl-[acyl-carrier-protein] synthase II